MIKNGSSVQPSNISSTRLFFPIGKCFCAFLAVALLLACAPARADEADEQYLKVFSLIDRGDSLTQNGQTNLAKARYEEAQIELLSLKKNYPNWNVKAVSYRLNYVSAKIAALSPGAQEPDGGVALEKKSETKSAGATEVKLLSAGSEPRQVLRLHAQAGDKQAMEMDMKIGMNIQMGEMPGQALKMPTIKTTTELTVKDVSADGNIQYEMVITDVGVAEDSDAMPQMVEAMKASIGSIKGFATTGTMSSRGINKTSDAKIPSNVDPQVRQSMEQMKEALSSASSPLPEEAVGPGAKWEVKMPIKSQGMTINQTMTYELISVDGNQIKTSTVITQNAANQKIENPAMPGLKVDVVKMSGEGKGNLVLDLARILPTTADIKSTTEMTMGMNMGNQKQSMIMKMDLGIRMESK